MAESGNSLARAAISLGSNIEPEQNLIAAVRELGRASSILKASNVWESAPVSFLDQANFLNAAVLVETNLSAEALTKESLKPIESKLGRVRDPNNINAPRTIDLDLSIYLKPGDSTLFEQDLLTRDFVAVPLAEILPDWVHPQTGQTLSEIAAHLRRRTAQLRRRTDLALTGSLDRE